MGFGGLNQNKFTNEASIFQKNVGIVFTERSYTAIPLAMQEGGKCLPRYYQKPIAPFSYSTLKRQSLIKAFGSRQLPNGHHKATKNHSIAKTVLLDLIMK